MPSFQWDQHYITGLVEVDRQHHHLVDVINAFGEVVTRPEGSSVEQIEQTFQEVAEYALQHFAEEQALMHAVGVDPRHIEHHGGEHAGFIAEVLRLRGELGLARTGRAKPLLDFLVSWLAYHILGSDQAMAKQVHAIREGRTPAEAYASEERMVDGAVEPLLRALDGLFRQVTDRNRELLELNRTLEGRVAERTRELASANRLLEEMALTDVLTGLPNRRQAMRRLAVYWEESTRHGVPLACLMIDADGFKQVNDTYGHDAGDAVLQRLARQLVQAVRTDDLVCRLGGDEFIIVCPATPLEGALLVAEKARLAVNGLRVPTGTGEWCGSISVGAAARTPRMGSMEDLLRAADEGVYVAKRNGRNCVGTSPTSEANPG